MFCLQAGSGEEKEPSDFERVPKGEGDDSFNSFGEKTVRLGFRTNAGRTGKHVGTSRIQVEVPLWVRTRLESLSEPWRGPRGPLGLRWFGNPQSAGTGHARGPAEGQGVGQGWFEVLLQQRSAARRAYKRWARRRVLDWPRPAITGRAPTGAMYLGRPFCVAKVLLTNAAPPYLHAARQPSQCQPASFTCPWIRLFISHPILIPPSCRLDSVGDKGTRSHCSRHEIWFGLVWFDLI